MGTTISSRHFGRSISHGRRLSHCDNWQVHASAEAPIGTPSEPKALVKTFATSKRNNNNHGACACRAPQILHPRIHEADAVTATSEHRVNNHVRDVEVKNTIANDPGETQQAAIFAEANCVECAGDGLACGLAVHIRRSHELSELDKLRRRDRFLNDYNVGHDDLIDGPFCLAWPGRGTGEVALAPRRLSRPAPLYMAPVDYGATPWYRALLATRDFRW